MAVGHRVQAFLHAQNAHLGDEMGEKALLITETQKI